VLNIEKLSHVLKSIKGKIIKGWN